MTSDLIANLDLDNKLGTNRILVAKEINGCDSSFITSCVIGHCIRNGNPLLIITTHHSVSHYQNIGVKMNYNLQKHIDVGLVNFFNLGKESVDILLRSSEDAIICSYSEIEELFLTIKSKYGHVNIILDGITHLLDLGHGLKNVNMFCNNIINLISNDTNAFVLFHCNVASDEDTSYVMSNLLAHRAHTVLEVESLPSGLSADVTGHLTVKHLHKKFMQEHMLTIDLKPSKYLFKLFDRGVKLFAPGTV